MHSYRIRIWFSFALCGRTSDRVFSGLGIIFDNGTKIATKKLLKFFCSKSKSIFYLFQHII